MSELLIYLIKVTLISALLYGFYYIVLRNTSQHKWNRFFLLSIFICSFAIPILKLPKGIDSKQPISMTDFHFAVENTPIVLEVSKVNTSEMVLKGMSILYISISIVLAGSLLLSLFRMNNIYRKYKKTVLFGYTLVNTEAKGTPFSFFNLIFWNNKIDINSVTGRQILAHEMTHVTQLHSLDRLTVNLILTFCWINPVFWLIRKELFMIHEFLADQNAIQEDSDAFARMLLMSAYPNNSPSLASHFFTSPIKRRLNMINTKTNRRLSLVGKILTLPAVLVTLFAFSIRETTTATEPIDQNASAKQDTIKASFPGGDQAWFNYISEKLNQHLDSLQAANQTGTATVKFVVEADGALSNIEAVKMKGSYLSHLLIEALKDGPKWTPATANGSNIRFYVMQPLTFRISE